MFYSSPIYVLLKSHIGTKQDYSFFALNSECFITQNNLRKALIVGVNFNFYLYCHYYTYVI